MLKYLLVMLNNYFDITGNKIAISDSYGNDFNLDRLIIIICMIILFIIFIFFLWAVFSHIAPNYNRGGSII